MEVPTYGHVCICKSWAACVISLFILQDLCSLGITAFGPRRKIVCAIQELQMKEASTTEPAPEIPTMQEPLGLSNPRALSSTSVEINQGKVNGASLYFEMHDLVHPWR